MKEIDFCVDMDAEYLEDIGQLDDQKIVGLADDVDEILDRIRNPIYQGATLPWVACQNKLRARPGEVTLWAGYNGSGKSAILGQIMTHFCENNQKCLVASFEMPKHSLVTRHVQQVCGKQFESISDREYYNALGPMDGKYYIYTQTDDIDPERILACIHYAAKHYQVDHVVIDSLSMCNIPEGASFNANCRKFMLMLKSLAERHDIHIHVVAHLRKPDMSKPRAPSRFDIKYAGELTDMVHNVVLVWRNEPKESGDDSISEFDTVLLVDKQRNFTWQGGIGLSFDADGGSWHD